MQQNNCTLIPGGVYGTVRVLVRTVGGGESWTSQIVPKPGAKTNDTITEILGNRDRFTTADGGTDYVVLDTEVEFKVLLVKNSILSFKNSLYLDQLTSDEAS